MAIHYCGYCNELISKKDSEDIIKLIDIDYKILCLKHKKEIDVKGWIE